jgi:hypothetical protein
VCEIQAHFPGQHAHASQAVDDEAQPPVSGELARPLGWRIPVHFAEQDLALIASQGTLDLSGTSQCFLDGPSWMRSRMYD